jgi:DNA-directed RNA polymerase subunit RPC12/RpoP
VGEVSFCPECGAEVAGSSTKEESTESVETAACEKCDSQISLKADRCPQCGHEPGAHGIIATILMFSSLAWVGLMVLIILLSWVAVITPDFAITDALTVTVGLFVFSLPGVVVLYLISLAERKGPTGDTKTWQEMWNEAQSE